MRLLMLVLLLAGGTARGDATLDGAAIVAQSFKAGGDTVFDNGRLSTGQWQVRGGRYCSVWPPSDRWACYDVADDGSVRRGHLVP